MQRLTAGPERREGRALARVAGLGALLLLAPRIAFAHDGAPPRPHDLWSAWSFEPGVVLPLLLVAVLYAVGARRLAARRGHNLWGAPPENHDTAGAADLRHPASAPRTDPRRREALWFWLGWASLVLALVSPLHALGGALFSAHMTQHELLVTVSAPLLVLARPTAALAWGLPARWRRPVGRFLDARAFRWLAGIGVATALHAAALWAWHAPRLYELTLQSRSAHALQHASFFGSALLFWAAVLRPRRARHPAGIAALFFTALHLTALGALITVSDRLLIPAYASTTAPWGLMPLDDQALAGLIMWIPGGVAYVAAALVLLNRLLRDEPARGGAPVAARVLEFPTTRVTGVEA